MRFEDRRMFYLRSTSIRYLYTFVRYYLRNNTIFLPTFSYTSIVKPIQEDHEISFLFLFGGSFVRSNFIRLFHSLQLVVYKLKGAISNVISFPLEQVFKQRICVKIKIFLRMKKSQLLLVLKCSMSSYQISSRAVSY